jgi:hypothetical protein
LSKNKIHLKIPHNNKEFEEFLSFQMFLLMKKIHGNFLKGSEDENIESKTCNYGIVCKEPDH